jgi:hypothetical protein
VPFLNIAGGTCQAWDSDGSEFRDDKPLLDHIRKMHDYATLTTLRDSLSLDILRHAARNASVLPCTSLFAVDNHSIVSRDDNYIALNFMPIGGHYELGRPIDPEKWKNTFCHFAKAISRHHRCVLICHNVVERDAAKAMLPGFDVFYSNHYPDYLHAYAGARWGILNRVHGAFAMASLGKPSLIVGSDSRAKMASQIGLKAIFVGDATDALLLEEAASLETQINSYPEYMNHLKSTTHERYLDLLRHALG